MSTFIGKGATSSALRLFPYTCNTASLSQWAAVIYDSADAGNSVKAPTAEANAGFAGFLADYPGSSGTSSGVVYNFACQPGDKVPALLKAGASVTVGNELVIANTSGHVEAYDNSSMDDASIVAIAEETATAGGTAVQIQVRIVKGTVHKDNS